MPNYFIQFTPEGGPDGCRVVPADGYIVEDSGAVTFIEDEHEVASFAQFAIVMELNKIAQIEVETAAFFG
jgi:hypothetical protein